MSCDDLSKIKKINFFSHTVWKSEKAKFSFLTQWNSWLRHVNITILWRAVDVALNKWHNRTQHDAKICFICSRVSSKHLNTCKRKMLLTQVLEFATHFRIWACIFLSLKSWLASGQVFLNLLEIFSNQQNMLEKFNFSQGF